MKRQQPLAKSMLTISVPWLTPLQNTCTEIALRIFTALAGFYRPKEGLGLYRRQTVVSPIAGPLFLALARNRRLLTVHRD